MKVRDLLAAAFLTLPCILIRATTILAAVLGAVVIIDALHG